MKFGIAMFPTDFSISPADLAVAAEERGFDSVWYPDHSHLPASHLSNWPGGKEIPKWYYHVIDQFVALTAAAVATKTIKLATGICLVIQRDAIQVAKEVASLDHVSGGRAIFGIGGGWNAEEMENHGTVFKTRFKLMREQIAAMKAIWADGEAEFHGEFINFDPIVTGLKPIQKPHPPIIIGGGFPHAAKRAIEYCDGWIPIRGGDLDSVEMVAEFRQMAKDAGRDPDSLSITLFGQNRTFSEPDTYFDEGSDEVARFRDAGVDRICFQLPSKDRDAVLKMLDTAAEVMAKQS
jgi:probable F420-dependent oxidoreductase